MLKLLPIFIITMLCAVLSHSRSKYDPLSCTYLQKERFFYTVMVIALVLFSGMRTYYNDTTTYLTMYKKYMQDHELYQNIDWMKVGDNPGFTFVQGVMVELGFLPQTFLLVFSAFIITTNCWFFRKYSCNLWLSMFLFLAFAGFGFSMAAVKQCTAMAFGLIATDRAINKKYIWFLLYIILGSLFHPYAWMYMTVPFLFFRPWSAGTLVMLAIFACVGVGLESLLGSLLSVTDMLGEGYDAQSFTGDGVNPLRLLVTSVPMFLSLLAMNQISEKKEKDQYLIFNLTMLNTEIMFVALFGTANYFARLANYFLPYQAVSIPWLLKQFDHRGRKTMTLITVACFSIYLFYSYVIIDDFDYNFYRVTLWQYLEQVFLKVSS